MLHGLPSLDNEPIGGRVSFYNAGKQRPLDKHL